MRRSTLSDDRPTPRLFVAGEPLRGLASLAIVLYHLAYFTPGPGALGLPLQFGVAPDALSRTGQQLSVGLLVFFVLSGYLIGRPFVWAVIRDRPLPPLGEYAKRRFLRIAPAMWVTVAATAVVLGLDGTTIVETLAVFAFVQTLDPSPLAEKVGHLWSVDVEMAFYVAVPIAAVIASKLLRGPSRRRATWVAGSVAALAGLSLATRSIGPAQEDHDLLASFMFFAPGLALAIAEPFAPRISRARVLPWLGAAAIAVVVLAQPSRTLFLALDAFAAACFVAGPLMHQWNTAEASRLLDNAPLRWLGSRSYSLYLVHLPVMVFLLPRLAEDGALLRERVPAVLACLFASLAVADLSFRLVERPFLRRRGGHHPAEDGAARTQE